MKAGYRTIVEHALVRAGVALQFLMSVGDRLGMNRALDADRATPGDTPRPSGTPLHWPCGQIGLS